MKERVRSRGKVQKEERNGGRAEEMEEEGKEEKDRERREEGRVRCTFPFHGSEV